MHLVCLYIYISILDTGVDGNSTSSGCRRKLPTLPPNRSPRNSIGGEGCSAASLLPGGQHRSVGHNAVANQFSNEPWSIHNFSQDKNFEQSKFGWIQFSLILEQCNLYVTVWSAQGLLMIEDEDTLSLPSPYVIVRLYSSR